VYHPEKSLHVSVVVSKKIEKGAVQRNKIRRRLYDIVRKYHKENVVTGVYIFLVKAPIVGITYATLKEEVQNIIARVSHT
jgi:ribonuclease P protein component